MPVNMNELLLTQDKLKELLEYNQSTGIFTWKVNRRGFAQKGSVAGYLRSSNYVYIGVYGRKYFAHRLAWLYMTGSWPNNLIDHANGIRSDNRFSNLRNATHSENQYNQKTHSNNLSGVKGVGWHKEKKKWQARCRANGKIYYLGYYAEIYDAELAVKAFRENQHKDFTNHG